MLLVSWEGPVLVDRSSFSLGPGNTGLGRSVLKPVLGNSISPTGPGWPHKLCTGAWA